MRRLLTLSSELFKVPLEGLRTLFADRRFRWAVVAVIGVLVTACATIAVALQFWLFPRINDYRDELSRLVGQELGITVQVGHLHGEWSYAHPRFVLDDVVAFDAAHRPAVQLTRIAATLSWWELLTARLGFRSLDVTAPTLDFRRDKAGKLFLAGLPLSGGGDFQVDALLDQGELSLMSDKLTWTDAQRGAPALALSDVLIRLRTRDARHRLDIAFSPPKALGTPVVIRMNWIGRSFSEWEQWQLTSTLKASDVDFAAWKPWIAYPVNLSQGRAKLDVKVSSTGLDVTQVEGNVVITDLNVRLSPSLDPLALKQATSEIQYIRRDEGRLTQLKLNGFSFTDGQGNTESPSDLFIQRQINGDTADENRDFEIRASRMDLARIHALTTHFPLPDDVRKTLNQMQPAGVLKGLVVDAQIRQGALAEYALTSAFNGLALRSDDGQKFVRGLSGKVDLTHAQGKLLLDSKDSVLAAPGLLPINQVPLSQLSGKISWQKNPDSLSVKIKSLQLQNDDLQAVVNGSWSGKAGDGLSERERAGVVDMKIVFDYAKTESGWKYVPLSASADISSWMKGAISDGTLSDFRIEMAGPVWDMPFGSPVPGSAPGSSEATGVDGKFYLGFKTSDLTVKYGDGYPPLKKLDATFAMNKNQIVITANDGRINDMRFSAIKAEMADVSAFENHLVISGQAQGPTESAVRFLQETPVAEHIHHFADGMEAQGNGKLDLTVDLNLLTPSDVKINGSYAFQDNRVTIMTGALPVTSLNGSIRFTERSLDSNALEGQWSGQPLAVKIASDNTGTRIDVSGRASAAELRQFYTMPIFDQLSGQADWQARVSIRAGKADLTLSSDLKGLSSSLSEPFNKPASTVLPLSVSRQSSVTKRRSDNAVDQVWKISLGNALGGTLGLNSRGQLVRGRLILGSALPPASVEQPGIQVESLRPVDLDYWIKALGLNVGGASAKTKPSTEPLAIGQVTLKAPLVKAFGQRFQDFRGTVQPTNDKTTLQLSSRELQGDMDWYPPGKGEGGERGLLQGHLSRLDLTAATDANPASAKAARSEIESLPDLAFRVDELFWQGKPWGKLNFRARNQTSGSAQSWRIDPLQLDGADLRFSGRLNWVLRSGPSSKANPQGSMTALDFKMQSPQVGNLLTKLGFPGTVKRGTAQLDGQVSWPANPFAFDPGRLSGNYKMTAKNGQFVKMDPGAGRLLGLLSLQSLPQRLSLDFRDIFSEGLAFEAIEGRFDIRDGVMKTSDLEMDTPAARVLMRGETNLAEQTQDVLVVVRPSISNSVALGVTVINPIVGAATFVTQKVLGDPLSKLFSYQYHITGTWSDPQVDKESLPGNVIKAGKDVVSVPVDAAVKAGSAISSTITGGSDAPPAGDKP
ncbi:MAG: hypothetical protein RIQ55_758 [Pseudomonadota bacterium]